MREKNTLTLEKLHKNKVKIDHIFMKYFRTICFPKVVQTLGDTVDLNLAFVRFRISNVEKTILGTRIREILKNVFQMDVAGIKDYLNIVITFETLLINASSHDRILLALVYNYGLDEAKKVLHRWLVTIYYILIAQLESWVKDLAGNLPISLLIYQFYVHCSDFFINLKSPSQLSKMNPRLTLQYSKNIIEQAKDLGIHKNILCLWIRTFKSLIPTNNKIQKLKRL